jgi:hypothetical protein
MDLPTCPTSVVRQGYGPPGMVECLALQLRILKNSESMGNHDSNIVDACSVD